MKKNLILALVLCFAHSTIARPFADVVQAMLAVIPKSEEALRTDLSRLIHVDEILNKIISFDWQNTSDAKLVIYVSQMSLIAPESRIAELWVCLSACLQEHFPAPESLNTWQTQIIKILLGDLDYELFLDT